MQGIDYIYTINGRLKSINNPINDGSGAPMAFFDPGKDGVNNNFDKDIFAMSLDYYMGDYIKPSTLIGSGAALETAPDQFNGNIKSARWLIKTQPDAGLSALQQNAYVYSYDKQNRLTQATWGSMSTNANINASYNYNEATNNASNYGTFTPNSGNDYKCS